MEVENTTLIHGFFRKKFAFLAFLFTYFSFSVVFCMTHQECSESELLLLPAIHRTVQQFIRPCASSVSAIKICLEIAGIRHLLEQETKNILLPRHPLHKHEVIDLRLYDIFDLHAMNLELEQQVAKMTNKEKLPNKQDGQESIGKSYGDMISYLVAMTQEKGIEHSFQAPSEFARFIFEKKIADLYQSAEIGMWYFHEGDRRQRELAERMAPFVAVNPEVCLTSFTVFCDEKPESVTTLLEWAIATSNRYLLLLMMHNEQLIKHRYFLPLHVAARLGNSNMVAFLVQEMIQQRHQYSDLPVLDVNKCDGHGNTALHVLCMSTHVATSKKNYEEVIFSLLCDAGGDVSLKNAEDFTPFELAVKHEKNSLKKIMHGKSRTALEEPAPQHACIASIHADIGSESLNTLGAAFTPDSGASASFSVGPSVSSRHQSTTNSPYSTVAITPDALRKISSSDEAIAGITTPRERRLSLRPLRGARIITPLRVRGMQDDMIGFDEKNDEESQEASGTEEVATRFLRLGHRSNRVVPII